ncbi:TPA: hypothetical protein ACPZSC_002958 [Yersinia enterocolitica]
MTGLVVIIICIVISVFCHKKIANIFRNKGRGSVRTFLTALISSVFLFLITMGIGVANFFPKDKSSNIIDVPKVPMIKWSTTENMEEINALIEKDLKENPELTRKILKEISSYQKDSVERTVAESDYVNDGVSYADNIFAIEKSNCRQELKEQLAPYTEWKNSQDWRPFSEFPKSMLKQEMYRRDIVNTQYLGHKTDLTNIFMKCTFSLRDSIPHLLRPDAKPTIQEYYIPEKLQCVKKNGGNYNVCYP